MKSLKPILFGISGLAFLLFGISFLSEGLAGIRWVSFLLGIGAISFAPSSKLFRAAIGTMLLLALVYFTTQGIANTSLGRKHIDLTEDNRYTLTEGTDAILSELTEPVTINYYVTRDLEATPAEIKRYISKVDGLLAEFEALAKDGNLTVKYIDPKPNTDEEDAANLDQIQAVPITQLDQLRFGVSVSAWDKKTVIPFLDPNDETQLEYKLISAIAEVSRINKPVVGFASGIDMAATGGQGGQGWVFHQFLTRSYNVADLGMEITYRLGEVYQDNEWGDAPDYLDPKKIPVVLLVHPTEITPEAEYRLDQYLLRGGTVIACVDAFSYAAQSMNQQLQQSMVPGMPPQGNELPTESSLPKLFEKLNINFSGNRVVIDGKYGQPGGRGAAGNPAVLTLDKDAIPNEDDLVMSSLNDIFLVFSGAFEGVNAEGLKTSYMLRSSKKSALIAGAEAGNPNAGENLRYKLRSSDRQYNLGLYISGKFSTAFPDGDPSISIEQEGDTKKTDAVAKEDSEEKKDDEEEKPASSFLKEGQDDGHLYLIGDSDFLADGVAYRRIRIGNMDAGYSQTSDNAPMIFNILDQATNSKHLVGSRARTPSWRPFTVFKEMESKFRERTGEELDQFEKEQKEVNDEIMQIQASRKDANRAFVNPEQAAKLRELEEKKAFVAKRIRETQKDHQSEIDAIKSGIFWKSLLTVPSIVILTGLGVYIYRRKSTQAR